MSRTVQSRVWRDMDRNWNLTLGAIIHLQGCFQVDPSVLEVGETPLVFVIFKEHRHPSHCAHSSLQYICICVGREIVIWCFSTVSYKKHCCCPPHIIICYLSEMAEAHTFLKYRNKRRGAEYLEMSGRFHCSCHIVLQQNNECSTFLQ